jgi:DNA-binding response OmpR family regulator
MKKKMATLLLITADELLAKAYRSRLSREGFEVEHHKSGREGLSRAYQWCPDLMLLDLLLPGMSGLDVLKSLRDVPWVVKTHVVLLIDRTHTSDVLQECLFWGAGSCLRKDTSSLPEVVAHLTHVLSSGNAATSTAR